MVDVSVEKVLSISFWIGRHQFAHACPMAKCQTFVFVNLCHQYRFDSQQLAAAALERTKRSAAYCKSSLENFIYSCVEKNKFATKRGDRVVRTCQNERLNICSCSGPRGDPHRRGVRTTHANIYGNQSCMSFHFACSIDSAVAVVFFADGRPQFRDLFFLVVFCASEFDSI